MSLYKLSENRKTNWEKTISFSQAEVKGSSAGGDWKVLDNSELGAGCKKLYIYDVKEKC